MSRIEKEFARMQVNPSGWSYNSAARQLRDAGYEEVSRKGSHRTWKHPGDPNLFTIQDKGNQRVKRGYIRGLVKRIERLRRGDNDATA